MATVSITLTGVVFCFVLAPTMGSDAWNFQNVLTHVVVPIASVADFMIAGALGFSSESPFMGCLWWILAIMVFLILVGSVYLILLDRISKARNSKYYIV